MAISSPTSGSFLVRAFGFTERAADRGYISVDTLAGGLSVASEKEQCDECGTLLNGESVIFVTKPAAPYVDWTYITVVGRECEAVVGERIRESIANPLL